MSYERLAQQAATAPLVYLDHLYSRVPPGDLVRQIAMHQAMQDDPRVVEQGQRWETAARLDEIEAAIGRPVLPDDAQ